MVCPGVVSSRKHTRRSPVGVSQKAGGAGTPRGGWLLRKPEAMSTNASRGQEPHDSTETPFEFAVPCDGKVNVANHEHGAENVSDHCYTVTVEHGSASACTCPADEYHPGACKHRDAVEASAPVLAAAAPEVVVGGDDVEITTHVERNRFGRKTGTYVRCSACGREAISRSGLARAHDDDCPASGGSR